MYFRKPNQIALFHYQKSMWAFFIIIEECVLKVTRTVQVLWFQRVLSFYILLVFCHVNIILRKIYHIVFNTNTFSSKHNRYEINVNTQSYVRKESIQKPFSKQTVKGLLMKISQIKQKITIGSCLLLFSNVYEFSIFFFSIIWFYAVYYCKNIALQNYHFQF